MLDAFRRGDPAALTRVYRAYSAPVARFLARAFRVRDGASTSPVRLSALDLEDAHQEAFVRAFSDKNRLAYDGLRPYEAFLFTLARACAVDVLRSKGKVARGAVAVDEASPEALTHDAKSPEEQALESELKALVRGFLAGLPPELRAVAELRFLEGRAQEAAAEAAGLTRSELRTREKRVREAFAEHLQRSGWKGGAGAAAALLGLLLAWAPGVEAPGFRREGPASGAGVAASPLQRAFRVEAEGFNPRPSEDRHG